MKTKRAADRWGLAPALVGMDGQGGEKRRFCKQGQGSGVMRGGQLQPGQMAWQGCQAGCKGFLLLSGRGFLRHEICVQCDQLLQQKCLPARAEGAQPSLGQGDDIALRRKEDLPAAMVKRSLEIGIAEESFLISPDLDPAVIQHGLLRHKGALAVQKIPKLPGLLRREAAQQAAEKAHRGAFPSKTLLQLHYHRVIADAETGCQMPGSGCVESWLGQVKQVPQRGDHRRRQVYAIG